VTPCGKNFSSIYAQLNAVDGVIIQENAMNEPNDNLDELMGRFPPPPAPPWFEQRLMARLRAEREAGPGTGWVGWLRPVWKPLIPLAGAVLVAAGLWLGPAQRADEARLSQDELNRALDAFVAYAEQDQSWNVDF
jgi:hypothetical protein